MVGSENYKNKEDRWWLTLDLKSLWYRARISLWKYLTFYWCVSENDFNNDVELKKFLSYLESLYKNWKVWHEQGMNVSSMNKHLITWIFKLFIALWMVILKREVMK